MPPASRPAPSRWTPADRLIRRRHVFYIAGYDPQGVPGYYRLFKRELERFQRTWPVQASTRASRRSMPTASRRAGTSPRQDRTGRSRPPTSSCAGKTSLNATWRAAMPLRIAAAAAGSAGEYFQWHHRAYLSRGLALWPVLSLPLSVRRCTDRGCRWWHGWAVARIALAISGLPTARGARYRRRHRCRDVYSSSVALATAGRSSRWQMPGSGFAIGAEGYGPTMRTGSMPSPGMSLPRCAAPTQTKFC